MCKFSFIVPIYNVEKYLKRCLDSLVNQKFNDYEIILVNDGSTDNCQEIIDEYADKYDLIKKYKKTNGGLSDARNFGVLKSSGDYLVFVDSDDFVRIDMLNILDNYISNNDYDLVKFNYSEIDENNNCLEKNMNLSIVDNGSNVFKILCDKKMPFEMAWLYVYKRKFFVENNFLFAKGKIHEDFGLTPLVILKANKMLVINDSLYYYYVSSSSITRHNVYSKIVKMADDYLYHFDYLFNEVNNNKNIDDVTKKIFMSYISNAILSKAKSLHGIELKKYIVELKKRKISSLVIDDTIKRKLKKILLKFSINLYLKLF